LLSSSRRWLQRMVMPKNNKMPYIII
jgi:hypothetical protein